MANSNKNVVSGLSWVKPIALTMFVVSILLVLPALVAIIVSFIQPAVATISLYEISEYSRGFAFGSLTLFILSVFSLKLASGHMTQLQAIVRGELWRIPIWLRVGAALCLLLLAVTAIQGFRNVHLEGTTWITTGHSGQWPVTDQVAKSYLWLSTRASCLTVLLAATILLFVSSRLLIGVSANK
jgi:hypothetical protein